MISAVVVGVATALVAPPAAPSIAPRLDGTVGPGYTIKLKRGDKAVTSLRAGKYRVRVVDKSNEHNFHLKGPSLNKKTSVKGKGTVTWKVTLKKGKYTFVCDPHADTMKGRFTVK